MKTLALLFTLAALCTLSAIWSAFAPGGDAAALAAMRTALQCPARTSYTLRLSAASSLPAARSLAHAHGYSVTTSRHPLTGALTLSLSRKGGAQ